MDDIRKACYLARIERNKFNFTRDIFTRKMRDQDSLEDHLDKMMLRRMQLKAIGDEFVTDDLFRDAFYNSLAPKFGMFAINLQIEKPPLKDAIPVLFSYEDELKERQADETARSSRHTASARISKKNSRRRFHLRCTHCRGRFHTRDSCRRTGSTVQIDLNGGRRLFTPDIPNNAPEHIDISDFVFLQSVTSGSEINGFLVSWVRGLLGELVS
ncbi:hypothetical protein V1517DRAFT_348052 [Lipomyces orientalis]|uniref:Uncharacterized protein n=1 Tax=Lipomyces orientalis TaxID=1233043 RepID=A0ACC3THF9_9ASCO